MSLIIWKALVILMHGFQADAKYLTALVLYIYMSIYAFILNTKYHIFTSDWQCNFNCLTFIYTALL